MSYRGTVVMSNVTMEITAGVTHRMWFLTECAFPDSLGGILKLASVILSNV